MKIAICTFAHKTRQDGAYRLVKRTFDIAFSAVVIVAGAVPGVLLAAACAIDTQASPFYVEQRCGHKGAFPCLKLRTMRPGLGDTTAMSALQQQAWNMERKVDDDPRITRLGRLLRATSIDETPQLFNVLANQMSIVGPRAVTLEELQNNLDDRQRECYLSVPSGITGLWQTGPRNDATWASGRRAAIELDYVQRASLSLDALIILKTLKTMFVTRSGR